MSDQTITRAELTEAVCQQLGTARPDASAIIETILSTVSTALARGEEVKLSGFGAFELRDKAARTGRNPKTGEEARITPRRVLVFKASPVLKDRVLNGRAIG